MENRPQKLDRFGLTALLVLCLAVICGRCGPIAPSIDKFHETISSSSLKPAGAQPGKEETLPPLTGSSNVLANPNPPPADVAIAQKDEARYSNLSDDSRAVAQSLRDNGWAKLQTPYFLNSVDVTLILFATQNAESADHSNSLAFDLAPDPDFATAFKDGQWNWRISFRVAPGQEAFVSWIRQKMLSVHLELHGHQAVLPTPIPSETPSPSPTPSPSAQPSEAPAPTKR